MPKIINVIRGLRSRGVMTLEKEIDIFAGSNTADFERIVYKILQKTEDPNQLLDRIKLVIQKLVNSDLKEPDRADRLYKILGLKIAGTFEESFYFKFLRLAGAEALIKL